jgi:hypothetical protein
MKTIKVWCEDVEDVEWKWQRMYEPFGFDIVNPVEVKFNFWKLKYMLVFTVKRACK